MACDNIWYLRTLPMDLQKILVRFGPDQSYFDADLRRVYPFFCKCCHGTNWRLIVQPGDTTRVSESVKEQQRASRVV